MANLSSIYNSGSLYEQLISQVISVESQPRLKLKAQQSDQTVYKAILSDFSSKASALDSVLDRFQDPLQGAFTGKAATAGSGAGFTATAEDSATSGTHDLQVTRLAQADARLSKQVTATGADLAGLFTDAGDPPPAPTARSFTIHLAQPEGDPVDLAVSYTPPEGASNDTVLAGMAAAVNDALAAAETDGLIAEGTGVAASVVHETSGTSRLSLRGEATGYSNRLTFTDTDGVLAALEVNQTEVRSGTGGGAVHAVGTGAEDSALSSAFTLDGLAMYRDANTVDDALDGVTLSLTATTDQAATLTIGADVKGIRSQIKAFVDAYNGLGSFLTSKSKVDAEAGTRGVFAGDAAVRGLRSGLRGDLAREVSGAGDLRTLADLGISTARDGTLTLDTAALDAAIEASPDGVAALFTGDDGLAARLSSRVEGLLGTTGTLAQRRESADSRISRLGSQIERWETRLATRESSLRAQFAQLQELTTRAQGQQATLSSLFYY